jgi:hypothetical protein
MPAKPNFNDDAQLTDGSVRVEGQSPDSSDILDIRVGLVQGNQVASAQVDKVGSPWHANLPDPQDPNASSVEFQPGLAVAFGIETHRENLMTISWFEPVTIRPQPQP